MCLLRSGQPKGTSDSSESGEGVVGIVVGRFRPLDIRGFRANLNI